MGTDPAGDSMPLRRRWIDVVFVAFFVVNLGFITYFFDIEQLTVSNAVHMTSYPAWPPHQIVDLVHWYGNRYDPLLMARPAFFRMTIWIDVIAFGPFYVAAIYAFVRGRAWIRVPALVWSGVMMTNVAIILFAEHEGAHATPHFGFVLGANLPWFLLPVAVVWRLRHDNPFGARPERHSAPDARTNPARTNPARTNPAAANGTAAAAETEATAPSGSGS